MESQAEFDEGCLLFREICQHIATNRPSCTVELCYDPDPDVGTAPWEVYIYDHGAHHDVVRAEGDTMRQACRKAQAHLP